MKIFHLQERTEERWELDPVHGMQKRMSSVVKPSSTLSIKVPAGQFKSCAKDTVFEVDVDGNFDVPDDVGQFFVRMPGWHAGTSPFPAEEKVPSKPARVTKAAASAS